MVKKQQKRKKHIPQRTCIACRTTRAKKELVRIVSPAEGGIEIDLTGKRNGRGAYLCAKRSCWDQALKTGALTRALRVNLEDEDLDSLRKFAASFPAENLPE
jgi:predicted RNA-binding protein YlxR (DUF448 family)